jgi:serine protease inhibitor
MSRRVKFYRTFLIALLLLVFAGCSDHRVCPIDGRDDEGGLALTQAQLVSATNDFAFRLFREIVKTQPDSNVFVSPLSISMALGMTMNGASKATLDSMLTTLGFPGYSVQSADECYRNLIDLLPGLDPAVKFEVANSIWAQDKVTFEPSFLQAGRTYFDAEIRSIDFWREDAPDTINAWVNAKTHGKIAEIVPKPLAPAPVMILLNAIYFLADWKYQFDPRNTTDDWFYQHQWGGPRTACRMMGRPAPYWADDKYCDYRVVLNDDFQAVDLPYGDSLFTMTLILPRWGQDLDALISGLSAQRWDSLSASFHTCHGELRMPRFELKYASGMDSVLKSLGMGIAFDPDRADFSNMCRSIALFITTVRHKTYVRVDEVGTEAAAVTDVEVGYTSAPPECEHFLIEVNHPFMLVIRENRTNTVLFMGKIVNPGYFARG